MADRACDCSDACDFDEPGAKMYSAVLPTARKNYRCCECGGTIAAGQKYERAKGFGDGAWFEAKTCLACVAVRTKCAPNCFMHETLRDVIWDCLGEDYRQWPDFGYEFALVDLGLVKTAGDNNEEVEK